jgi:hypothetical protein
MSPDTFAARHSRVERRVGAAIPHPGLTKFMGRQAKGNRHSGGHSAIASDSHPNSTYSNDTRRLITPTGGALPLAYGAAVAAAAAP